MCRVSTTNNCCPSRTRKSLQVGDSASNWTECEKCSKNGPTPHPPPPPWEFVGRELRNFHSFPHCLELGTCCCTTTDMSTTSPKNCRQERGISASSAQFALWASSVLHNRRNFTHSVNELDLGHHPHVHLRLLEIVTEDHKDVTHTQESPRSSAQVAHRCSLAVASRADLETWACAAPGIIPPQSCFEQELTPHRLHHNASWCDQTGTYPRLADHTASFYNQQVEQKE